MKNKEEEENKKERKKEKKKKKKKKKKKTWRKLRKASPVLNAQVVLGGFTSLSAVSGHITRRRLYPPSGEKLPGYTLSSLQGKKTRGRPRKQYCMQESMRYIDAEMMSLGEARKHRYPMKDP
ncbi:hypothetical protein M8J75_007002 [Diaphorina citri]|nr:hypothetical protein M8J75_007002 [Diaphorina citri]